MKPAPGAESKDALEISMSSTQQQDQLDGSHSLGGTRTFISARRRQAARKRDKNRHGVLGKLINLSSSKRASHQLAPVEMLCCKGCAVHLKLFVRCGLYGYCMMYDRWLMCVCVYVCVCVCVCVSQDTNLPVRPYFSTSFWILDMSLILLFLALVVFHILSSVEADQVDWTTVDGFVNVYELAELVRVRTYLLAVTLFLVIIKLFEFLRVNRSLSTFILVIRGLLLRGMSACSRVMLTRVRSVCDRVRRVLHTPWHGGGGRTC